MASLAMQLVMLFVFKILQISDSVFGISCSINTDSLSDSVCKSDLYSLSLTVPGESSSLKIMAAPAYFNCESEACAPEEFAKVKEMKFGLTFLASKQVLRI